MSFDNFYKIFEYFNFNEFVSMLWCWYDNKVKNDYKWINLVLILIYLIFNYFKLNINSFFLFNLGEGWNLGDFSY